MWISCAGTMQKSRRCRCGLRHQARAGSSASPAPTSVQKQDSTTNPILNEGPQSQVNLDNITFISNERTRTDVGSGHRHAAAGRSSRSTPKQLAVRAGDWPYGRRQGSGATWILPGPAALS